MLPPTYPKLHLNNYLLKIRDDVRIIGISELIAEWHKDRFKSYSEASRKFHISESFYRSFITKKRPIPIWVLKILSKYDKNLLNNIYNKKIYFSAKHYKDNLPFYINPQLAYYIGFLHGDGHIDKSEKRITFSERYIEQLELINKLTKIIFNTSGSIYLKKNKENSKGLTLDIRRVTINSFFSDVIGIKKGRRYKNKIPNIIKENKQLLKWYLCGLFDAEGAMPLNPKVRDNLYVDIAMKDIMLIKNVKELLENVFDIKVYGPYKKLAKRKDSENITIESELKIRKQSEIKKFLLKIGTIHPDKVRRKYLILNLLGS